MGQKPFKNRRKRLIVNKPLQKKIIFGVSFVPLLALVGATLAVSVLASRVLDEAGAQQVNLPTLAPMFLALFVFILAAGGVVVLQALRYSNRIAGPQYRIVRSLKQVRTGDYTFRIRLRKGDELSELAEELNCLLAWLEEHPPEGIDRVPSTAEVLSAKNEPEESPETVEVS